jgi:LysR family transcriptional regulator of abg operon
VTSFDFTYQPLFTSSHAVVARQNHPRAECRSLEELFDADWLVALDPETEAQASSQRFARHGLPMPRSVHFLHSLTVAVALLKRTGHGQCFSVAARRTVRGARRLGTIPLREQLEDSTVGITTRAGEPADAASQCFIDCLVETIRDESWTRRLEIRGAMQSVEVLV